MHAIRLALLLSMLTATTLSTWAKVVYTDPYKDYEEAVFMDMDLEQNLLTPQVAPGEHPAVSRHMKAIGHRLADKGYTVDLMRDDEVVLVSLPTDELFAPNDTLLSPAAPPRLLPLTRIFTDPEMYKMVYAVHTDNTGSPKYNMQLSHQRNNTIYDWLLPQVSEDLIVIPYEMGDTDPVEPNNTSRGRAANRRLEIYIIPGPKLIVQAHKGALR